MCLRSMMTTSKGHCETFSELLEISGEKKKHELCHQWLKSGEFCAGFLGSWTSLDAPSCPGDLQL